jgi:small subunit ribosomal protein S17
MFIAKVVRSNVLFKAVRVSVQNMEFDPILNVYFNKEQQLWASDPTLKYGAGDLVLVKKLSEPLSTEVHHYVSEIMFPIGNVVDPITGRRCRGPYYLEEENRQFKKLDFADPSVYKPASSKAEK